jgi:hypothetical protein
MASLWPNLGVCGKDAGRRHRAVVARSTCAHETATDSTAAAA